MSSPYLIMNRVGLIVPLVKPLDIRKFESSSYQALKARFNPYRAFVRRALVTPLVALQVVIARTLGLISVWTQRNTSIAFPTKDQAILQAYVPPSCPRTP
ncbi:hypothetical protein Tco_0634838 [Tanacetum coccineum]